jgi:acetyl-CoA carboxylase carboxyl transferase subunit beta
MDLKDWFASRQKRRDTLVVKQPLTTEEYCALWTSCFQCRELIYTRDLRANNHVCPKCQFHFRIGANQRIEQLLDTDSFVEIDRALTSADPLEFKDTDTYVNRLAEAKRKSGLNEAIICGTGTIDGQKLALAVMEFGHFGGSMGSVVGEKVTRTVELALEEKLPVVIISSSGGARMQEGILSLMQMAKTSSALQELHKQGLLYISILTEPTFGGVTASFAMLGDIIIAEPGARIGFAGQRVIEQTIRQKLPADFQTAEYLMKHGQVDLVVERGKLRDMLAKLLTSHSPNKNQTKHPVENQKTASSRR